ncbi:hypothetical protein [uncultured Shewanella sp.]|uniref:hypothetical protein n=1 Tax=uncultured Shewanella sp. TaxID=173975 RepID=UPI00261277B7|nr:hypothetical protein [uncultured Shewanella sp.]
MTFKIIVLVGICIFSRFGNAEGCQLPVSLNTKQILFMVNELYTPKNPSAGEVVQAHFTEKKISSMELMKGITSQGVYEYRIIEPGVGLLEVQLTGGDDRAKFRTVLMCENDFSGKYIFSQSQGMVKPDKRTNTGSYFIE